MKLQKRKRSVGINSFGMKKEITDLIKKLNLQPHPEGGFFIETYRSNGSISESDLGSHISGSRNYSTAIYFLLTSDTFSAFHRINQDEIWHFYKGAAIKLHLISEDGKYSNIIIGNNISQGEHPQCVVPARYWFAAEVTQKNDYSLVGCTVSPGFDFKDFELPKRKTLISLFPNHKDIITKLTR